MRSSRFSPAQGVRSKTSSRHSSDKRWTVKHDDQQGLARLRAIVEAYGANPELWPAEERNAVGDLVSSSEARAWLEAESRVDAWLADEPELAPSADLLRRVAEIPLRHEARPASARPASWIWPFGRL